MKLSNSTKGNSTIIAIIITAIVVGLSVYFWQNYTENTETPAESNKAIVTTTETKDEKPITPDNTQENNIKKTYTSNIYALSFEYPENWTVNEDITRIDVQPPPPAQWSNYFTLETLNSKILPNNSFEEYITTRDLTKANFTIDGKEVYTKNDTSDAGTMMYFLFSHQNKVYELHLFETWYDMPEVQTMITSLKLN